MRYQISLLILVILLIISGCKGAKDEAIIQEVEKLKMETLAQKDEINKSEARIDELLSENKRLLNDLTSEQNKSSETAQLSSEMKRAVEQLTQEYENFFYLTCKEVQSSHCPSELKYFDPRNVKLGDSLFGMKVSHIETGTFGPRSYIVAFKETVEVSGKYTINKDDPMGPYLWLKTNKINGQNYNLDLDIGGNVDDLNKLFKDSQDGETRIKIKDITIQSLPNKPATNVAIFVSLMK